MADFLEMALPRERQFDAGSVRFVRRERRKIKPRRSVFQKGNASDCTTSLRAAKQEKNAPPALAQKRKKHLPICCAAGNSNKAASETLLPSSCSFNDGCWMPSAKQFREKTKICNFDEILAC